MPVSRLVAVNPSFVVERVGSDYLMLTASGAEVVRATGDAADVITCAINGQPLPQHLHTAADVLQSHGVLTTTTTVANTFTPSRRHALQLGAAAAAVGLTMLALPNAAAAASTGAFTYTASYDGEFVAEVSEGCYPSGVDNNFDVVFTADGTFTVFTVPGEFQVVDIILVGGGGGGEVPAAGQFGGGGGGGGIVNARRAELTAQTYTITVGTGGSSNLPGNETTIVDGFFNQLAGAVGGAEGIGGYGGTSGGEVLGGSPELPDLAGGGGGSGRGLSGTGIAGGDGGPGDGYPYLGYDLGIVGGGGGGGGIGTGGFGAGAGGDGSALETSGTAGAANTGNGGGGGYDGAGGEAGGSGVVIIRFTDSSCPVPG
jgi:hypothetical protein